MLYFGQRASDDESVHDTLVGVVAGVVALVPQGLVLLLSMAQAVAVIRLGRKQVLVQRLQAVETLARVTVLASDKTGTLTTGAVTLETGRGARRSPAPTEPASAGRADAALAAVAAADEFPNATMKAIQAAHPDDPGWPVVDRDPVRLGPQVLGRRVRAGRRVVRRRARGPAAALTTRKPVGSTSWPPKGCACCCSPRRRRCRPPACCPTTSRRRPSCCSPTRSARTPPRPSTTSCARTCARR